MAPTLLFVHGTGVRKLRYAATVKLIKEQAAARALPIDVKGCFWGEAAGAKLGAEGASIPTYDTTGGQAPSAEDEAVALWSLLYTDPWYELRLLRHLPAPAPIAPSAEPASARLVREICGYQPSEGVIDRLDRYGLRPAFDAALAALQAADELEQAAQTASDEAQDHRRAIARALVAGTLATVGDGDAPLLDGESRDDLTTAISDDLSGNGLGIGSLITRPVKGLATWHLKRQRGSITDGTAPLAGDVLRFLAHGDSARVFLRAAIADHAQHGPVYLLGHSLGGIMCVDLLVRAPVASVAGLITVGSQAPFLYEIGALPGLEAPNYLPDHFPDWINVYDRRDILSYVGGGVFPGRVTDVEVDTRQPFPASHSAYWTNAEVWKAISEAVR